MYKFGLLHSGICKVQVVWCLRGAEVVQIEDTLVRDTNLHMLIQRSPSLLNLFSAPHYKQAVIRDFGGHTSSICPAIHPEPLHPHVACLPLNRCNKPMSVVQQNTWTWDVVQGYPSLDVKLLSWFFDSVAWRDLELYDFSGGELFTADSLQLEAPTNQSARDCFIKTEKAVRQNWTHPTCDACSHPTSTRRWTGLGRFDVFFFAWYFLLTLPVTLEGYFDIEVYLL